MSIVFSISYAFWFISEIVVARLRRAQPGDLQNADKNSLPLIWIVLALSMAAAIIAVSEVHLPISGHPGVRYAGLALLWIGVLFRLAIIASLGQMFTVNVTIRPDHRLKTDGFYRHLRHPSYTASLLTFFGFGITLNNWLSLILITIPVLAVLLFRIRVEEKALTDRFGQEYLHYKKSAKALVPFIF